MKKMKADNLIGLGNHDQRRTENHSNQEIDPTRSHFNYDLVQGRTENFKTDIQAYIDQTKLGSRATRKDAVLVNEWVISSDQDFFKQLSPHDTRDFFQATKDFFARKFGEENIRYAVVHMDETTPHMHMGVVPFDENYKLSAKRVFNRQALQSIQEDLHKMLQERGFDIKRGEQNSERKSLTVPEYKAMQQKMDQAKTENSDQAEKLQALKKQTEQQKQELETLKQDTQKQKEKLRQYQFADKDQVKIARKPARFKRAYSVVQDVSLDMLERDASEGKIAQRIYTATEAENEKLKADNSALLDSNEQFVEKNKLLTRTLEKAQGLIRKLGKVLKEKLNYRFERHDLEQAGMIKPERTSKQHRRPERKNDGMHL